MVKLYGWEEPLEKQVEKTRQQELRLDQLVEVGRRFDDLFRTLTPFLVSFFTFLDVNGVSFVPDFDEHYLWNCNC